MARPKDRKKDRESEKAGYESQNDRTIRQKEEKEKQAMTLKMKGPQDRVKDMQIAKSKL